MRFPKFWQQASNETGSVVAWGWSENSPEEAQQNAQSRFQRIMTALKTDQIEDLRNDYQYVIDNMIREFVVERIEDHQGHETAVISRNGYGSLILNTPQMIMIDLDIPESTLSVGSFFGRLFGGTSHQISPEVKILERLTDWQLANSEFSFRIYRTAAGLRAIVINQIADGVSPQLIRMMNDLESDPLYRELCRSQACFRARLTQTMANRSEKPKSQIPIRRF